MKITLVQPPILVKRREFYGVAPPIGLCYIAAILEHAGHSVKIIDGIVEGSASHENGSRRIGLRTDELCERIINSKPDAVGISCPYSLMWQEVSILSEKLKALIPQSLLVLGGFHPSALPIESLRTSKADCIVIGEGEETFPELIDSYSISGDLSKIRGLAFKQKDSIILTPQRQYIQDLDSIPFPARHLIPMEKYIIEGKAPGSQKNRRFTTMLTSRGCPNKCVFCSIKTIWGQKWRARTPENVVNEIEDLVNKFKIKEIHFVDDNITLDKKRIERICDLIIEKDLDISWTTPNGVYVTTLDKNLLNKMKKSGCFQLAFGIESGNEHVLRNIIHKPLSLPKSKEVITQAKAAGIWTHGFFVIGFPGETYKMIRDTFDFSKNAGLDSAFFSIATPFPGTELYRLMKKESPTIDFSKLRNMDSATGNDIFSAEEIVDLQKKLIREFYKFRFNEEIHPGNMLRRLKNIRSISDIRFLTGKVGRLSRIW